MRPDAGAPPCGCVVGALDAPAPHLAHRPFRHARPLPIMCRRQAMLRITDPSICVAASARSGSSRPATFPSRGQVLSRASGPPPAPCVRLCRRPLGLVVSGGVGLSFPLLWHDIMACIGALCTCRLGGPRGYGGPRRRFVAGMHGNHETPSGRQKGLPGPGAWRGRGETGGYADAARSERGAGGSGSAFRGWRPVRHCIAPYRAAAASSKAGMSGPGNLPHMA